MKINSALLLFVALGFAASGCETKTIEDDCTPGEDSCHNNVLYQCVEVNGDRFLQIKEVCKNGCENNQCAISCVMGRQNDGSCTKVTPCLTQNWEEDGRCSCPEECPDDCNDAGMCETVECMNGYNADGSCICPAECPQSCTKSGECECPEGCTNGCDAEWEHCCDANCKYGCNGAGQCLCDETCRNECDTNGECCPDNCKNGCDLDQKCTCLGHCAYGCNEDGECNPNTDCRAGWKEDGSCVCPDSCKDGCFKNGVCIEPGKCENTEACTELDYCQEAPCYCDQSVNKCKMVDINYNHLQDVYENLEKYLITCSKDSDCGADGFCDSFLNYRCSTRCTKDEQCVDYGDDGFHYVCRKDGRCAPDSFVTVWSVKEANSGIQLPAVEQCQFHVDWGDGAENDVNDCSDVNVLTHVYGRPNTYTVTISPNSSAPFQYDKFSLCNFVSNYLYEAKNQTTNDSLVAVKAFGPVGLESGAFCHCDNLKQLSAVDIPDASKLTSMAGMFSHSKFNLHVENWDVSNVTSMLRVFQQNSAFNQPLNRWNVSNVTTIRAMFWMATAFNQPLNDWDVSGVTNMGSVFVGASNFNRSLDKWNVENVTDMSKMFQRAKKFNQNLNTWNTSNVTNMGFMFDEAVVFNTPLNQWNTSNVTNMESMFKRALKFNQPIGNWKTSSVTNMNKLFTGTVSFNQPINNWDVSHVTDMEYMFSNAGMGTAGTANYRTTSHFNQPLDKWNVSNVRNMANMFFNAGAFNQNIEKWKVKKGTKLDAMLKNSKINNTNYCKIKNSKSWEVKPVAPSTKFTCK